jgi:hypothetical protein
MAKLLIGVLLTGILLSCNNNDPKTTESSPNLTNVQNVNGNIPDTTSSISLENRQTVDSLPVSDSLKNKR